LCHRLAIGAVEDTARGYVEMSMRGEYLLCRFAKDP
jgi:hypothetical protein